MTIKATATQLEFLQPTAKAEAPATYVPSIQTRQPDGSIVIRAGKPIVLEDMIGTTEAARILGMSQNWVSWQCQIGGFKTAYQPAGRNGGRWRIARAEVMERRLNLTGK